MRTDIYSIASYFTDSANRLTPSALCKIFQESARLNAQELKFGYHDLMRKNMAWYLGRLYFKINSLPGMDHRLWVSTWPSGTDGIFALRDFRVTDENSVIICKAKSYWAVVDVATKRPQRLNVLDGLLDLYNETPALDIKLQKLDFDIKNDTDNWIEVRQSDIDIAMHVNNTRYVDWITDDIAKKTGNIPAISEFEINFISEASAGEKLKIVTSYVNEQSNQFNHIITHENGLAVCKAVSIWKTE